MDDIKQRLQRCFSMVFPALSDAQIAGASPATVGAWDSVASVTLFAVIEEEFALEIDVQDMKDLLSFDSTLEYLRQKYGPAPS